MLLKITIPPDGMWIKYKKVITVPIAGYSETLCETGAILTKTWHFDCPNILSEGNLLNGFLQLSEEGYQLVVCAKLSKEEQILHFNITGVQEVESLPEFRSFYYGD